MFPSFTKALVHGYINGRVFFVNMFHFRQKSHVNEKNPQLAEDFRAAIVNGDIAVIQNFLDKGKIVFGCTTVRKYSIVQQVLS